MRSLRLEADSIQGGIDFRIRHELLPDQTGAVILDHHDDRRLIQPHVYVLKPIFREIEAVSETVRAPQLPANIAIEMLQRFHGLGWGIRKRSQGRRAGNCAIIVAGFSAATAGVDTGGAPPGIVAVAGIFSRVRNSVRVADQCDVAAVSEVVCVPVFFVARVKAKKRVLGEEEVGSVAFADIELDAVVSISIRIVIALFRATLPSPILNRPFRLPRPAGVVHRSGYGMH